MSDSTTEKYFKSALIGLKTTYNHVLANRKLETEFLNIKNQVFKVNSEGNSSFTYTYHYKNDGLINDNFPDLLNKLAICFPDSSISYILNTHIDIATAITAQVILAKAEAAISTLSVLMSSNSDNGLNTPLNNALEYLSNAKVIAMDMASTQVSPINSINPFINYDHSTNPNPLLANYNQGRSTIINIIKIDWA